MGALGQGQRESARDLIRTIERVIQDAEKNNGEARRLGQPVRQMAIFVPKEITIRPDLRKRLKDAGVVISRRPVASECC